MVDVPSDGTHEEVRHDISLHNYCDIRILSLFISKIVIISNYQNVIIVKHKIEFTSSTVKLLIK